MSYYCCGTSHKFCIAGLLGFDASVESLALDFDEQSVLILSREPLVASPHPLEAWHGLHADLTHFRSHQWTIYSSYSMCLACYSRLSYL